MDEVNRIKRENGLGHYKAYTFDLDDNLLTLPTKVILEDLKGNKKEVSTKKFEKIRYKLKENGLRLTKRSFKNFENDEVFLRDIKKGKTASSWKYLVDCITVHANIFGIITARGHSPQAIKKGLKIKILETLSKEQLTQFVEVFKEKSPKDLVGKSPEEIFEVYLDTCKFYPCNYPKIKEKYGADKNVSELKVILFRDFRKHLEEYIDKNFDKNTNLQIGFSDDSTAHLSSIANSVLKDYGFFFFHTKETGISDFIDSYSK